MERFLKIAVSGVFRYLGVESSITRLVKPITSPRGSMTGSIRRLRYLSYTPPPLPATASPASMRSALSYPLPPMAWIRLSQASGAAPRPNRAENLGLIRRLSRI